MKKSVLPVLSKTLVGLLVAVGMVSAFAQAKKEVTFAHQDMLVPFQAIIESGWGRSNAAKKTHNYFGITTTRRGMGFAVTASATTTYFLKAYDHLRAGIEDYALILNTHGAYRTFRELRHQARQELRIPTPHELLPGLIRWSERREAYLAKLALVIDHYLPAYNQTKQDIGLHPEPRLWVLKRD